MASFFRRITKIAQYLEGSPHTHVASSGKNIPQTYVCDTLELHRFAQQPSDSTENFLTFEGKVFLLLVQIRQSQILVAHLALIKMLSSIGKIFSKRCAFIIYIT